MRISDWRSDVCSSDLEAGIQPGDVVVSVNGEPVETSSQLRPAIGLMAPGEKVKLGIIRDGEKTDVTATLAKREAEQEKARGGQPASAGAKLDRKGVGWGRSAWVRGDFVGRGVH